MEMLISLSQPWHEVLRALKRAFVDVGLDVVQSFDLQSARSSMPKQDLCACPDHGTADCTCQYVVVLVRREGHAPLSVEIHGHDDRTYVSLVHPYDGIMDECGRDLIGRSVERLALAFQQAS